MNDSDICRVLLIEDDPGDANLARQFLRLSKEPVFDITWVTTLAEARQAAQAGLPEVLLLDLSLPDSAGFDTVHNS